MQNIGIPLSRLITDGLKLEAHCINRTCFRFVEIEVEPLIEKLGPHYPVPHVGKRLVCSVCGGREVQTRPAWHCGPKGMVAHY